MRYDIEQARVRAQSVELTLLEILRHLQYWPGDINSLINAMNCGVFRHPVAVGPPDLIFAEDRVEH